ncbi:hypothetical protein CRENBAI_000757 [Crenichthys baileyi]|uniref:C2 domain-containing protein n=1 Tax=Crenichthys baileyi TaxID=28760 RepID=A0AAV9RSQ4_9TELE
MAALPQRLLHLLLLLQAQLGYLHLIGLTPSSCFLRSVSQLQVVRQLPEVMASSLPLIVLLLCCVTVAHSYLEVYNLRAQHLRPDHGSNADGFVRVNCGSWYLGQTDVFHDNPNPSWGKRFTYSGALQNDLLIVRVYDKDVVFADELGSCRTPIRRGTYRVTCNLRTGGSLFFTYRFR